MFCTHEGVVAEKRSTCALVTSKWPKIVSMSSAKPILSISSASSRMTCRMLARLSVPRSRWSMMRPGVGGEVGVGG